MRFTVNYDNKFFYGKGLMFMYDTALVFEGIKPKFFIPFLQFAYQLLFIQTTRTVPYATILQYRKPNFRNGSHRITYRLPNGKKCNIGFRIKNEEQAGNSIYFTTKLEEYLAVVKSFSTN